MIDTVSREQYDRLMKLHQQVIARGVQLETEIAEARWGIDSLEGNLEKVKQDREAQVQIIIALRERVDRLAEENEAQHHAIRELEATIEQAVNLFKDFAAHNDAESIGNPVLWNSVLSVLTGSDEA